VEGHRFLDLGRRWCSTLDLHSTLGWSGEIRSQRSCSLSQLLLLSKGLGARGYCRHTDTKVGVYDTEGQLLGTDTLRPGDNVEVAAKKLLRDSAGGFYGRINYSRSSLH
jgi:hypothetical protein